MQKVLFIGKVWPEPNSSAAGTRILQLINFFRLNNYEICFASGANKTPYSHILAKEIFQYSIKLNDNSFDQLIKTIKPNIVVFDRFSSEEHYGWRVRENAPDALTILDTEDLHFLRKAREISFKKETPLDLYNDITIREISAILRCDLSLLISPYERKLLETEFRINPKILFYLPFLEDASRMDRENKVTFEERQNFVFIGNFLHEPNYQTVLELKRKIWPELSKKNPKAELHIYGAYATEKIHQLHNAKERFIIKGRADNAINTLSNYRLLLAPIPFGAGIKGKFIDAMHSGTPSITTTIGAEGMLVDNLWNGYITDDLKEFISISEKLYNTQKLWKIAQNQGYEILKEFFDQELYLKKFLSKIISIQENLRKHRKENFLGHILNTNQFNSSKYLSLWIEEKNKKGYPNE